MSDWRSRLDNIKTLAVIDPEEYKKQAKGLKAMAACWNQCATHEYREQLQAKGHVFTRATCCKNHLNYYDDVVPDFKSSKANSLGYRFYSYVDDEDWDGAYRILNDIEALT